MLGRDTPPAPLERGGLNTAFYLIFRGLWCCVSPSQRGDKGVCYGEGRGVGGVFFAAVWWGSISWASVTVFDLGSFAWA